MHCTIAPILSTTIIHGNITIDTLDISFNFYYVFRFRFKICLLAIQSVDIKAERCTRALDYPISYIPVNG